jgi:hypothetical protein
MWEGSVGRNAVPKWRVVPRLVLTRELCVRVPPVLRHQRVLDEVVQMGHVGGDDHCLAAVEFVNNFIASH